MRTSFGFARFRSFPKWRRTGIAFAAALLAGVQASSGEEIWIGPSELLLEFGEGKPISGNWSVGASWADGTAPAPGGGSTLDLRFGNAGLWGHTAVNDLGPSFVVNHLVLDNDSQGTITLANAVGSSLWLGGVNPVIEVAGNGNAIIDSLQLAPGTGTATITGRGYGNLQITNVGESGGARSLIINGMAPTPDSQIIRLGAGLGFTGGVTLQSGNLDLVGPLNGGPLTINGGTIRFTSTYVSSVNSAVALNTDLVVVSGSGYVNGVISSATPGTGLLLRGGTLNVQSASTYYGPTTIERGSLDLREGGSILNSSEINVRAGSTLNVWAQSVTGATNRITDIAPINLHGGQLHFSGLSYTGTTRPGLESETVGPIHGSGYSTVFIRFQGSENKRLTAASLSRVARGTFAFEGASLGANFGPNVSNILFTQAPDGLVGGGGTGPDTSILPYAISSVSFVTYHPVTGIRPLGVTEYANTFADAAPTNNVSLSLDSNLESARRVNSLRLLQQKSLTGAGLITLTSGALLLYENSRISNPLDFGATEANVFTLGDSSLSGAISGSGGLTKSGEGRLTLAAANSFTGQLTINSGLLSFSDTSALGADLSAILINGRRAGLEFTASGLANLSRPLILGNGVASLSATGAGELRVTGPISGSGGVRIGVDEYDRPYGTVRFASGNTYSGQTEVSRGNLIIGDDTSLGAGGSLLIDEGGILTLSENWTTGRNVISRYGELNTNGFTATLSGLLTGAVGSLAITGEGALRITRMQPSVALQVQKGRVEVSGAGGIHGFLALHGSVLSLDNTAEAFSDRVSDSTSILLDEGSELALLGNANTSVAEISGRITQSSGNRLNIITLTAPGTTSTRLKALSFYHEGRFLIRGDNLGGEGGAFTRVQLTALPETALGLVPRVIVDSSGTGLGSSFAVYDATSDAAGAIGFRPLRAAEYSTGPVLRNPSNGGSTPVSAHFLATGATSATGGENSVASLTLDGGSVSLGAGQSLRILGGNVLVRAGLGDSALSDGVLDFGTNPAGFTTVGNLTVDSVTRGAGLVKTGAGTLTIGPTFAGGSVLVMEGTLRPGPGSPFSSQTVTVLPGAAFELNDVSTTVGALAGLEEVRLGTGTLSIDGPSSMSFLGSISGAGAVKILEGANSFAERGLLGANTFSGGTTLDGGILYLGHPQALGTGPLTVNGGLLRYSSITIATPIVLNSDLVLGTQKGISLLPNLTLGPGSSLSGTHGIDLRGAGSLTIQIPSTHSGETQTGFFNNNSSPGAIVLAGALGSARSTSAFRIQAGGRLVIDDTVVFAGAAGGRVSDLTPVHLQSGWLQLVGNATASSSETIGALSASGYSTVTVAAQSGAGAQLLSTRFERIQRGTVFFRGSKLGGAPGPGVGNVLFATAPEGLVGGGGTGPNRSILPYAIGDTATSGYGGLVTYELGTGIRPLDPDTEYATDLTTATPTSNVRLTGAIAIPTAQTVNALVLRGANLSGSGNLNITSGTLLSVNDNRIYSAVNFGPAEANIFSTGLPGLSIYGAISGSGGLTKSGQSMASFYGDNTFTGQVTINGGTIEVQSGVTLGLSNTPIIINSDSTGAGLSFAGSQVFTRAVQVNEGLARFGADSSVTMAGPVTGLGGLLASGSGLLSLTGTNTYTGNTYVRGNLAIPSDAALGNGGCVSLGGTIRLNGPWISNRTIELEDVTTNTFGGTIDTNGQNATLNGPLFAPTSGTLTKAGAGTLKLTNSEAFAGTLSLKSGRLEIENTFGGAITADVLGTLGGNGVATRPVTVTGGTIDPGSLTAPGLLTLSGLTLQAKNEGMIVRPTLKFDVKTLTDFDVLKVNGTVAFTSVVNLSIQLGFDPRDNVDSFLLLDNDGSDPISVAAAYPFSVGTWALNEGDLFFAGGQAFRLSYKGGDGNDLVIRAVPEPGTAGLCAGGMLALAVPYRRRRRRTIGQDAANSVEGAGSGIT